MKLELTAPLLELLINYYDIKQPELEMEMLYLLVEVQIY